MSKIMIDNLLQYNEKSVKIQIKEDWLCSWVADKDELMKLLFMLLFMLKNYH